MRLVVAVCVLALASVLVVAQDDGLRSGLAQGKLFLPRIVSREEVRRHRTAGPEAVVSAAFNKGLNSEADADELIAALDAAAASGANVTPQINAAVAALTKRVAALRGTASPASAATPRDATIQALRKELSAVTKQSQQPRQNADSERVIAQLTAQIAALNGRLNALEAADRHAAAEAKASAASAASALQDANARAAKAEERARVAEFAYSKARTIAVASGKALRALAKADLKKEKKKSAAKKTQNKAVQKANARAEAAEQRARVAEAAYTKARTIAIASGKALRALAKADLKKEKRKKQQLKQKLARSG